MNFAYLIKMSSSFSTNPEGLIEAGLSFKIGSSSRTGGCGCTGAGGGEQDFDSERAGELEVQCMASVHFLTSFYFY